VNIYVDCGFYIGINLKQRIDAGEIDDTWTIYAFEPSTFINIDDQIERFLPIKINLIKKAVWIKGGKAEFKIAERSDASHIVNTSMAPSTETIVVDTIDFSKFISELPDNSNIICSMDIEGAEFTVLEKMISDGTLQRLNELDIEFHHRLMPDKTPEDAEKLIDEVKRLNIKLKLKVELR
jgi:FkbM family methyltransferase